MVGGSQASCLMSAAPFQCPSFCASTASAADALAQRRARRAAGGGAAAAGMTPETLADLVERLVAQRERERREGTGHDDEALYEEMVTALKAEMARLGKEVGGWVVGLHVGGCGGRPWGGCGEPLFAS